MNKIISIIVLLTLWCPLSSVAQSYKKPAAQIELPNYKTQYPLSEVLFSPDSKFAVLFTRKPVLFIYVYDLSEKRVVTAYSGHKINIREVDISPDGKSVASIDLNETIKIWDPYTGDDTLQIVHPEPDHPDYNPRECKFFPDGKKLLVSYEIDHLGYDGKRDATCVWDTTNGNLITKIEGFALRPVVAIHPDGRRVMTPSGRVYDVTEQKFIRSFPTDGSASYVTNKDLTKVYTRLSFKGDKKRYVTEWDFETGSLVNKSPLENLEKEDAFLEFSPQRKYLISKFTPGYYGDKKDFARIVSMEDKQKKWVISKKDLLGKEDKEEEGVDLIKFSPDETKAIVTVGSKVFLYEFEE